MRCPYCGAQAMLRKGSAIYKDRPDLARKNFYMCSPCDAYVGCHGGSVKPLGTLANKELRLLRGQAHKVFDRLWKEGYKTRSQAYKWMSDELFLEPELCHIAMFGEELCEVIIDLASKEIARMEFRSFCIAGAKDSITKGLKA